MICVAHLLVYQALLATQTTDVNTAGHQSIDDDDDLMDTSHTSTAFNEQHALDWAINYDTGGCHVFTRNEPDDANHSVCNLLIHDLLFLPISRIESRVS